MVENIEFNKKNRLFANIGKLITSSLDTKEILEGIMAEVEGYFKPEHWSLLKYDTASHDIYFAIFQGSDFEQVKDIRLKVGEGIAGEVVKTGKSIFVPDTSLEPRFSGKVDEAIGFTTKTIIAVPIKFRGVVFGVIEIINRDENELFTEEDHIILQSIADFSAIAFFNNSLYKKAIERSEIDILTGVYSRGKLENLLQDKARGKGLYRRGDDIRTSIIIIYIDLDYFKDVNDTYGHSEGDEVLKKVAQRLQSIFRSDDMIFRVGGDEFMVLLELEEEQFKDAVLGRIEETLQRIEITSIKKDYRVKLSFGTVFGCYFNLEELINDADKKMYEYKNSRR